jgi:hypothetical protein
VTDTLRSRLRSVWRDDRVLRLIVLLYTALQVAGCLWDLPGDHGWENDGIAPRGLFAGLAGNLQPGNAHRYPLLHHVLALIPSLPALLLTPLAAGSLAPAALHAAASGPLVMSGVSLAIKLLSIAMSALSMLALASFAQVTIDRQAARWSALFFATNLSLSYYGRVSNLDGPYLMWAALLLERLPAALSAAPEAALRRYLQLGALAAAAMATKDQAYAAVFPLLAAAALRRHTRAQLRNVGGMALGFLSTYALASGALLNPTGFVARIALITGPNNQDWKVYDDTWAGLVLNLRDIAHALSSWWWPWPVLALSALGLSAALLQAVRARRGAALLPLLMALGNVCLFTLVVRRTEHRFVLPAALAASYYAGLGANTLLRACAPRPAPLRACTVALYAALALAALPCTALLATQWGDSRRALIGWLATRPRGTRVETYGLPVYQPHYQLGADVPYRVTRVRPPGEGKPAELRGIVTLVDSYGNVRSRAPDVLVIPEGFATRLLEREQRAGERTSRQVERAQQDADAVSFFRAALTDRLPGYRVAWVAHARLPAPLAWLGFEPISVHGSTATRIWVLVRAS